MSEHPGLELAPQSSRPPILPSMPPLVLFIISMVETTKREMFSQKSVRRFVGNSSAFVMGAMLLASALNRSMSPRY